MKKLLLLSLFISALSNAQEIQLKETLITSSTGFEESAMKENKNVTVITKEDLEKKVYTDISEIFRDAPNVVVQNTHFGPVIDLRGNGERAISRVKILVDGISANPLDESMGVVPLNTIPSNSIERIEIIPGGGAVLNGSGTAGGIINIITKSSARKNFFNSEFGGLSYDTQKYTTAAGYNITDSLYANFGYSYLMGEGYRDGDKRENGAFNGGIDYKINDKNRIRFQGSKFSGREDGSYPISKELLAHDRRKKGFSSESKTEREVYSVDYEYKATENLTLLSTFYKQNYEKNFTDLIHMKTFNIKMGSMPFPITMKDVDSGMDGLFSEKTQGIKLKSKYKYENGEIILGYDYSKTDLIRHSLVTAAGKGFMSPSPSMQIPLGDVDVIVDLLNDMYKETHGFYGLNKYNLNSDLQLTTGLRFETSTYGGDRISSTTPSMNGKPVGTFVNTTSSDKTEENFAGELGLNYAYNSTGSVYTRYERGFISPVPGQATNKIAGEYYANDIKSETSNTFEVGLKDFIGNTFASLAIFTTFTDDEITIQQGNVHNPATKEWIWLNLDKTRRIGTELFLEQYFGKLTLNQGITYVNAKITKGEYKGEDVPLVPEGKITLGASYKFTEKFSTGLLFNYIGKTTVREYDSEHTLTTNKTFKTDISSHNFTNLNFNYKVNDYFYLGAGVNNLFNNKYNYTETRSSAIPAPERNYYLSGSIKL
ncbi:MAG: TonB-dependent receptor [Fusobacteriaceae bacterium]